MNAKKRAFALSVVLILAFSAAVSARQNSTDDPPDTKSAGKSAPAQPAEASKPNAEKDSNSVPEASTPAAESKTATTGDESSAAASPPQSEGAASKAANSSASKSKSAKTAKTTRKGKAATKKAVKLSGKTEKATFAAGCFWSVEAVFERVPGVISVVSGFSGGIVPNPSYQLVCTGQTGHAESVQITYDPELCTYENLLKVFWSVHDPTTWNAQGDDHGPQYRSVIFYHNDAQKEAALKSYKQLTAAGTFGAPIVTQLMPMKAFFPAEDYHQNYYRNHMYEQYADFYITPKIEKLRKKLHLR
jgi:peptide-methionine (S)-S-oxide reductase